VDGPAPGEEGQQGEGGQEGEGRFGDGGEEEVGRSEGEGAGLSVKREELGDVARLIQRVLGIGDGGLGDDGAV